MDLYKQPKVYDIFHSWKTDDIEFIVSQAKKFGGPVLELAAGTGRLGYPVARGGLDYTGIELSRQYVDEANRKLADINSARVLQGDMCRYRHNEKLKFIFIGFNSLLHLETEKRIKTCFNTTRNNLEDEGTFLIDIFVPDPAYLYRNPEDESEFHTFEHPEHGLCRVYESGDYSIETQLLHVKWRFHYASGIQDEIFKFYMHILYPDTMDRMLDDCHWRIFEKFGDYNLSPLSEDSPKQIYLCRKK